MQRLSVLAALATILICSVAAQTYPKSFMWGTATASYQVEGAWNVSGTNNESIFIFFNLSIPSTDEWCYIRSRCSLLSRRLIILFFTLPASAEKSIHPMPPSELLRNHRHLDVHKVYIHLSQ
jgi:hypothetical protein